MPLSPKAAAFVKKIGAAKKCPECGKAMEMGDDKKMHCPHCEKGDYEPAEGDEE